ncbi:unnamed protein product, partial [Musa acuminata var. zebrina]
GVSFLVALSPSRNSNSSSDTALSSEEAVRSRRCSRNRARKHGLGRFSLDGE